MVSFKECIKLLLDHGADVGVRSRMDELAEECLSNKLPKKDKSYVEELFVQARKIS